MGGVKCLCVHYNCAQFKQPKCRKLGMEDSLHVGWVLWIFKGLNNCWRPDNTYATTYLRRHVYGGGKLGHFNCVFVSSCMQILCTRMQELTVLDTCNSGVDRPCPLKALHAPFAPVSLPSCMNKVEWSILQRFVYNSKKCV